MHKETGESIRSNIGPGVKLFGVSMRQEGQFLAEGKNKEMIWNVEISG